MWALDVSTALSLSGADEQLHEAFPWMNSPLRRPPWLRPHRAPPRAPFLLLARSTGLDGGCCSPAAPAKQKGPSGQPRQSSRSQKHANGLPMFGVRHLLVSGGGSAWCSSFVKHLTGQARHSLHLLTARWACHALCHIIKTGEGEKGTVDQPNLQARDTSRCTFAVLRNRLKEREISLNHDKKSNRCTLKSEII